MNRATMLLIAGLLAGIAGGALAQQNAPVPPFKDVPRDHWAYQAVENLRQRGILRGYPNSAYRGKRTVTRYEAVEALNRIVSAGSSLRLPPYVNGTPDRSGPPGDRGPAGPKGERSPKGETGPRGRAPLEVSEFQAVLEEMLKETTSIRRHLDSADSRVEDLKGGAGDLKKGLKTLRTGK